MWPSRSSAHTGSTRMPVDIASGVPASTAPSIGVSAPSGRISAHAKGRSSGCFGIGVRTHAHVVTTPAGPTSTISWRSSPVTGSYSVGGTSTRPSAPLMPTRIPSRRPVRNAPTTGPVVRLNGYSMTSGAVSTSSAIGGGT